ncbi:MAG: S8 family serine peptidase [Prochlorococcaceae cyanobacterium]
MAKGIDLLANSSERGSSSSRSGYNDLLLSQGSTVVPSGEAANTEDFSPTLLTADGGKTLVEESAPDGTSFSNGTQATASTSADSDLSAGPTLSQPDPVTGVPTLRLPPPTSQEASGLYLIGITDNLLETDGLPQARALQRLAELNIQPLNVYRHVGIAVARLTPQQAQDLKANSGVSFVEANQQVFLLDARAGQAQPTARPTKPGDGGSTTSQVLDWGVKEVWNGNGLTNWDPAAAKAWVIDSGVSTNTKDLVIDSRSTGFYSSGSSGASFQDADGHGTHVAGIIAAQNNTVGTVGVAAGAAVVALRVFFPGEATYDDRIIAAINYAVANKNVNQTNVNQTNVINMSLGRAGGLGTAYTNAISAAVSVGFQFAIAAGNEDSDVDNYSPASAGDLPGVFTVSAAGRYAPHPKRPGTYTATTDERYPLVMAHFSNYDNLGDPTDDVAYAAPGLLITSLGLNGELVQMSGTSMASPHMAGALLRGNYGTMPEESIAPFFTSYNGDAAPDPLVNLI